MKTPRVYTSDPAHEEIRIRLYAQGVDNFDSVGPAMISPARVEIPDERRGQDHRMSISNMSHSPLVPNLVSDHPGVIEVDIPSGPINAGENKIILVRASDELKAGRIKTSFTLEFNDPENTRYTIPVIIGSLPDRNRHTGAQTHKPAATAAIQPTGGG